MFDAGAKSIEQLSTDCKTEVFFGRIRHLEKKKEGLTLTTECECEGLLLISR